MAQLNEPFREDDPYLTNAAYPMNTRDEIKSFMREDMEAVVGLWFQKNISEIIITHTIA